MKEVKILVVDDSAFMRRLIINLLNNEPDINVIGSARNGEDALKKVVALKPDLVTLDIQMPVMDGLVCLEKMMTSPNPVPVIMLSSLTGKGAEDTMKALELGAVDFIQKPSGVISLDIDKVKDELIEKIRMAAKVHVHTQKPFTPKVNIPAEKPKLSPMNRLREKAEKITNPVRNIVRPEVTLERAQEKANRMKNKSTGQATGAPDKLLVIGTSTGGPRALQEVVPYLPADIPAAIMIVQHMPAGFTLSLAKRLDEMSNIIVREAKEGDTLEKGVAYIAPGGYHMVLASGGVIKMNQEPTVQGVRPSYDVLLSSIPKHYSGEIVNVVMTGMGKDGADGTAALQKMKVKTIVEDESTCVVYGMPKAIVERKMANKIVPLDKIANEIMKALV